MITKTSTTFWQSSTEFRILIMYFNNNMSFLKLYTNCDQQGLGPLHWVTSSKNQGDDSMHYVIHRPGFVQDTGQHTTFWQPSTVNDDHIVVRHTYYGLNIEWSLFDSVTSIGFWFVDQMAECLENTMHCKLTSFVGGSVKYCVVSHLTCRQKINVRW